MHYAGPDTSPSIVPPGTIGGGMALGKLILWTHRAMELCKPPPSGQSEDYGVQGQPDARPDHRAVDADVLQIAP
jgi:hypothetical protein